MGILVSDGEGEKASTLEMTTPGTTCGTKDVISYADRRLNLSTSEN
jgi:hypothetical protein